MLQLLSLDLLIWHSYNLPLWSMQMTANQLANQSNGFQPVHQFYQNCKRDSSIDTNSKCCKSASLVGDVTRLAQFDKPDNVLLALSKVGSCDATRGAFTVNGRSFIRLQIPVNSQGHRQIGAIRFRLAPGLQMYAAQITAASSRSLILPQLRLVIGQVRGFCQPLE